MSAMNADSESHFRLGLLLAGGGARVRRLVGGVEDDEELLTRLEERGAPRAVLDAGVSLAATEAHEVLARTTRAGWHWVVPRDTAFPDRLKAISDPPLGLFVRGKLDESPTVAVVGSRKATPYGLQVGQLLGEELGRAGVVVVSGMARGVDAAAHRGALETGGASWAVWGTGPDRIYPREHAELAEMLVERGALITEYPPGTPPRRHHFPERNRILAGLVQAIVVVEAAARSGALVTARLGLEEGREVLAVPGNIFSELSVGPNTLLRVGARPLLTPRDLFHAIGLEPPSEIRPTPEAGLMQHIGNGESLTVDEIAARADRPVADVLAALLELEVEGDLHRDLEGRYARVRVFGQPVVE
jgi:DNA processing protein